MFASFSQQSKELDELALAENTRKAYECLVGNYILFLEKDPDAPAPFPITEDTARAYITYRLKAENKTYGTIKMDLAALRWAMRRLNQPDPTRTLTFRGFMQGVKRESGGDFSPYQKKPLTPEILTKFADRVPDENADKKVRFMAFISTAFLGFLRVNEILSLTVGAVEFEPFGKAMTINISRSKTDQFAKGEQCRVVKSNKKYCAVSWMSLYFCQLPNDPAARIFQWTPQEAREKLRKWLRLIGMEEEEVVCYSTHSCRSGGAPEAARVGIQDSVIQRHGRWKSTCFMKYTRMARTEAGEIITSRI